MLHVPAAIRKAEKRAEGPVSVEPVVRNCAAVDWKECLTMLSRQGMKFQISGLSEKRLQDVGGPDVRIT